MRVVMRAIYYTHPGLALALQDAARGGEEDAMPPKMLKANELSARTRTLSWTTTTRVFLHAAPPRRPREICGVIDARASLRRVRRGHRGQVRLVVKPAALEAAVDAAAAG